MEAKPGSKKLLENLKVCADAFLYEPGVPDNIHHKDSFHFAPDYLTTKTPTTLSHHNKEFK